MTAEIFAVDSEWGFRDGKLNHESALEPVVFCFVGLTSHCRLSFWDRDPALRTFFREHADDLFVAHYAVAEMKYLLRRGIPLPKRWFDTFVAFRLTTNRPGYLEGGLAHALQRLELPGLTLSAKEELRREILYLRFDAQSPVARNKIMNYCLSDCDGAAALYGRLAGVVNVPLMEVYAEYLKAVARMELRGILFDAHGYRRIQRLRPFIAESLIADVNATCQVFVGDRFDKRAFLDWARRNGIQWPVRVSKTTGRSYHPLDKDTFKEMEARDPFIAEVRQVRKTLKHFEQRVLAVDPVTARHYFSTSAFRSVTGRNQPRGFVFSGPKWLRSLITPSAPDRVLVYLDYVAQEVGIAAALSRDPAMREVYEADDCHMAFAIRAGAAPAGATKESHPDIRKQFKTVNLGVLYGQTAYGIAARLGVSIHRAEQLLAEHKALFPVFWRWSERMVQTAFDRRQIHTPCGWRSRVPFPSNERTWMNWPMQATGGDVMRLTVIYLDRQNVSLLAPVHDGFLLECRKEQLADVRAAIDYACGTAVEHVLPGFRLRWDVTVHEGRFHDEDGEPLWTRLQTIMETCDGE